MVAAVQGVLWHRQLQQGQHLPCQPTPPPTTTTWTTSAAARQEVQSGLACPCPLEEEPLQGAVQFNLRLRGEMCCISMRRLAFSISKFIFWRKDIYFNLRNPRKKRRTRCPNLTPAHCSRKRRPSPGLSPSSLRGWAVLWFVALCCDQMIKLSYDRWAAFPG